MTADPTSNWRVTLADLVEERIGVRLRLDGPLGSIEPFVKSRMEALNLEHPSSYVEYLRRNPPDGDEFKSFTSVCTNGQTSFFRDGEQFKALSDLASSRRTELVRPLQIWSAGCSTGDEPYSIAMLMSSLGIEARVLATDINPELLRLACEGCYGDWSLRNLPQGFKLRFLEPLGNRFSVSEKIRRNVEFRRHNLVTDDVPLPSTLNERWDVIFCRNVFIYYARCTVESVLARMADVLEAQGRIFLAASESLHDVRTRLRPMPIGARFAYGIGDGGDEPIAPRVVPGPEPVQQVERTDHDVPTSTAHTNAMRSLGKAANLIRDRDFDSAREELENVLQLYDDHVIARITLGHLFLQTHAFEQALEVYSDAQMLAPLSAEVHYFQGVVHRKVGNMEQAELALRRALFLEPDFWPASFMLAGIYDRRGRPDLSQRELRHTLELCSREQDLPFRSHTEGLTALHLVPPEVARVCRQRVEKPGQR